jgi:hypothetical protein
MKKQFVIHKKETPYSGFFRIETYWLQHSLYAGGWSEEICRELFVQFMARIAKEMSTATLAMFSTLKYVNAPNFEKFRNQWNAKYLGGFVVHSKAFDGLVGNFPIGFLCWKIHQNVAKTLAIVNHFMPYTEVEVNAPERFESDFMALYLAKNKLSKEAKAVLNAGRELWQAYFAATDVYNVREELKLNRADVGWYQIRNALKARNTSGDFISVGFSTFETAYKTLSEKLQPQVFELGFLRA